MPWPMMTMKDLPHQSVSESKKMKALGGKASVRQREISRFVRLRWQVWPAWVCALAGPLLRRSRIAGQDSMAAMAAMERPIRNLVHQVC
jgi:hypothetical protein